VFCPYCKNPDSRVMDSRTADDGAAIRRAAGLPVVRAEVHHAETVILMVGKRSGANRAVHPPQDRQRGTPGLFRGGPSPMTS